MDADEHVALRARLMAIESFKHAAYQLEGRGEDGPELAEQAVQVARAALWAFASDRSPEIEACLASQIPCHVLWAESDTILSRADGRAFAERLHATFTVANRPAGYPRIDHDWMFDDPELFVEHLEALGLVALRVSR